MNYTTTTQAPVTVQFEDKPLQIPRFVRKDWKAWASLIDSVREEKALAELGDPKLPEVQEKRAKFRAFATIPCTSPRELRDRIVHTFDGQEHVVQKCLEKVEGMTQQRIDAFIEHSPEWMIEELALKLASMVDDQPKLVQPQSSTGTPQNPQEPGSKPT